MAFNVPLLSIVLYYVISQWPRTRAISLASQGDLTKINNVNPHGTEAEAAIKQRLPPKTFAAYERAMRCHNNCLENLPLHIAAVFAGLLAEREKGAESMGMTTFAIGSLVVRVVYCVNYMYAETRAWSYVRTAAYNVGSLWAVTQIGRAAWALA